MQQLFVTSEYSYLTQTFIVISQCCYMNLNHISRTLKLPFENGLDPSHSLKIR